MTRKFVPSLICFFLVGFVLLISSGSTFARSSIAYFNLQGHDTSAVDAKGIRHEGTSYRGSPPRLLDRVRGIAPYYPIEEQRQRHQGRGLVRMTIDLTTGYVIEATMIKSTGFPVLDSNAIAAFMTWRWRAGKRREIHLPVTFRIHTDLIQPLQVLIVFRRNNDFI